MFNSTDTYLLQQIIFVKNTHLRCLQWLHRHLDDISSLPTACRIEHQSPLFLKICSVFCSNHTVPSHHVAISCSPNLHSPFLPSSSALQQENNQLNNQMTSQTVNPPQTPKSSPILNQGKLSGSSSLLSITVGASALFPWGKEQEILKMTPCQANRFQLIFYTKAIHICFSYLNSRE